MFLRFALALLLPACFYAANNKVNNIIIQKATNPRDCLSYACQKFEKEEKKPYDYACKLDYKLPDGQKMQLNAYFKHQADITKFFSGPNEHTAELVDVNGELLNEQAQFISAGNVVIIAYRLGTELMGTVCGIYDNRIPNDGQKKDLDLYCKDASYKPTNQTNCG